MFARINTNDFYHMKKDNIIGTTKMLFCNSTVVILDEIWGFKWIYQWWKASFIDDILTYNVIINFEMSSSWIILQIALSISCSCSLKLLFEQEYHLVNYLRYSYQAWSLQVDVIFLIKLCVSNKLCDTEKNMAY